jgi:hypothetical protein
MTRCHRCSCEAQEGYVHCTICLTSRRAYFRAYRGSRRVTQEDKALAWLRGGGKTTREVYTLTGALNMRAMWHTLKRLEEKGKVEKVGRRWELVK